MSGPNCNLWRIWAWARPSRTHVFGDALDAADALGEQLDVLLLLEQGLVVAVAVAEVGGGGVEGGGGGAGHGGQRGRGLVEVGRAVEGEGGGGLAALGRLGGQRVGAARRDDLGGMRGGEAFSWRMTLCKSG